jgi:hypothetical protein
MCLAHILYCNALERIAVKYHIDKKQVMAKAHDNHNPAEKIYLIWLYTSIAVVFLLPFVLPFPISFIVSLILVLSLGIYRADMLLRKAGKGGIKDWYKSLSLSGFGRNWDTGINGSAYKPLRFCCMNCDNEHNKIACPKCGSKAVRAL